MDDRLSILGTIERELESTLGSRPLLEDRERFVRLVARSMGVLALEDVDVADRLPVSRSAVSRWRRGESAPLPMMRKPVYQFLLRKVRLAINVETALAQQPTQEPSEERETDTSWGLASTG